MPRGGYQQPKGPRPPSGPGKLSQRTDGNQPVQTPGLDNPDMQYGDVQKLRAGLGAAPIPQVGSPRPRPTGAAPVRPVSRAGGLPDFVTQGDSARPNEPGTAGLSTGAGPGPEVLPVAPPDERVQIAQYLWQTFGNAQALQYLHGMIDEHAQEQQMSAAPPPGRPM